MGQKRRLHCLQYVNGTYAYLHLRPPRLELPTSDTSEQLVPIIDPDKPFLLFHLVAIRIYCVREDIQSLQKPHFLDTCNVA